MKAVTWQGRRNISVETVPDPKIQQSTDAIIEVTTTAICGSDLHLYEVLVPFMHAGDILGHEPMGRVVEVGSAVKTIAAGDRVVVPFQISCSHCYMCERGLQTQCETTQVREQGTGAALFGYSELYGRVPGGQAQYLRVPHADGTTIKVEDEPKDERFLYLSDVLPTAWQGVAYTGAEPGSTVAVIGLGPIGDMACRIAMHRGMRVIGIDRIPERRERVKERGAEVIAAEEVDSVGDAVREMTKGRGADAVIDAVGMEAHGSPLITQVHRTVGFLPKAIGKQALLRTGVDRLGALYTAIDAVRRGGTLSISGVYGGSIDPMPLMTLFDKQIQIRMGQANVKRWVPDILPLLQDDDVLGVESFATHQMPLGEAPRAYKIFQDKSDGAVKILLKPGA